MLTDEQRHDIVQRAIVGLKKKKADDDSDNADEKEGKIVDPLKNMKAIVKHYGSHNRLK